MAPVNLNVNRLITSLKIEGACPLRKNASGSTGTMTCMKNLNNFPGKNKGAMYVDDPISLNFHIQL